MYCVCGIVSYSIFIGTSPVGTLYVMSDIGLSNLTRCGIILGVECRPRLVNPLVSPAILWDSPRKFSTCLWYAGSANLSRFVPTVLASDSIFWVGIRDGISFGVNSIQLLEGSVECTAESNGNFTLHIRCALRPSGLGCMINESFMFIHDSG